jgi:hypothetical protein
VYLLKKILYDIRRVSSNPLNHDHDTMVMEDSDGDEWAANADPVVVSCDYAAGGIEGVSVVFGCVMDVNFF